MKEDGVISHRSVDKPYIIYLLLSILYVFLCVCQAGVSERELAALKAVMKCIEDHGLEKQYPLEPLQERVVQLEKAKADKKRATEAARPQPKRPRAVAGGCAPRFGNVAAEKSLYPRVADRYPQYMYEMPYLYPGPTDNHGPAIVGSAVAYNFSPSHSNNYFVNGYQYQVPAPYLQ